MMNTVLECTLDKLVPSNYHPHKTIKATLRSKFPSFPASLSNPGNMWILFLPPWVFLLKKSSQKKMGSAQGWDLTERNVTQSCPTLFDSMDCSLPGSSVHGTFQAIVLEWIAISFSSRSSRPRNWTWVFRIVDRRFTVWAIKSCFFKSSPKIKASITADGD